MLFILNNIIVNSNMYDIDISLSKNDHGAYAEQFEIPQGATHIKKIKIICDDKISLTDLSRLIRFHYIIDSTCECRAHELGEFICKAKIDGKVKRDGDKIKIKLGKKCIETTFSEYECSVVKIHSIINANIKIAFAHKTLCAECMILGASTRYSICISRNAFSKNTDDVINVFDQKTYMRMDKHILKKDCVYKCYYNPTLSTGMYSCKVLINECIML